MVVRMDGVEVTGKPQINPEQMQIVKLDAGDNPGSQVPPKGGLLRRLEAQLGSIT